MTEPVSRPAIALIAHDIHEYGGMERAFAELIRRLSDDHRIVVVSATLAETLRPLVNWRRVPTPPLPFALKFPWFFVLGGIRSLRLRVDLVHVLGAIVPIRADVACVQFCHAGYIQVSGKLALSDGPFMRRANTTISRWLALQAERWCYRPNRLGVFGAVSAGVARELRRHYPKIPVAITPNGVDVNRYRPDKTSRIGLRSKAGISDHDFVALFVGGDWNRKGLAYAIQAVGLTRKVGVPTRLWVVGPGEVARFEEVARKLGVLEFVTFFGAQSATEVYFQAADVFVLPTLYETFSLVAYEAAASELPVIATAVSGIEELLDGNVAGIPVQRDAHDIARTLAILWNDEELRARLGATGRQRAGNYTWQKAAEAVRELYREVRCPQPGDSTAL